MGGHSDPVAQQCSPAVRRRRVDGENRHAHVALAVSTDERSHRRRLARARRARHADDAGRRGWPERVENLIAARTLDQAQQPAGRSG